MSKTQPFVAPYRTLFKRRFLENAMDWVTELQAFCSETRVEFVAELDSSSGHSIYYLHDLERVTRET